MEASALLLDEQLDGAGTPRRTVLRVEAGGGVAVEHDGAVVGRLPALAVRTVMARYGRPLDEEIALEGPALALGEERLRRLRWRAAVDALARDYLVWESPGAAPLAALGVSVAAALRHLAAAATRAAATSRETE
ncbi:MAG: hypothetical protein R3B48_24535 [Kofleriaceae bacterium]